MKFKTHAQIACALSLPFSLFVTTMVFFAARSTGNNGEFFDVITGSPTLDLVALLLIWFVVSALPVLAAYALLAVLFHLIRRR